MNLHVACTCVWLSWGETKREGEREGERERGRETERGKERETGRDRERGREREGDYIMSLLFISHCRL